MIEPLLAASVEAAPATTPLKAGRSMPDPVQPSTPSTGDRDRPGRLIGRLLGRR